MMKELISTYGSMLLNAIVTHTIYVVICVAIGFVLGLVLGVALSRIPRWAGVIMPVISVFQTIPGLVFIGILFLWLGMVPATVIIALSIYALFPVLKNTYAGLLSIDPKYVEAAKGCGMSAMQSILRVELPLAMPTIIAGLRMSTIYTVSWTVLASMIGLGGLGDFIYQGTASNNNTLILLGAIPAALLAILFGALIDLLQKKVTPRGLRKGVTK
ncbi:MAG: ABC transporter permease [Oscillospiraceae bacterium]|nr:ABC transporter permease [Oscillospiraceae bacterium]